MKLVLTVILAVNLNSFAQKATEQLNYGNFSLSIPSPEKPQIDEDFSIELPKEEPPEEINIVRPDEKFVFPMDMLSKSAKTGIPYLEIIKQEALNQNFDLELVLAVVKKESTFNPKAKSSVGAVGLMQLMPSTAKWLGLKDTTKLTDPATNVRYGIKYLRYLFEQFYENAPETITKEHLEDIGLKRALAAYNAGPGNVKKYMRTHNGIPPFKETKSYIKLVSDYFEDFEDMDF